MDYKEALKYLDSFIDYEKIGSYSYRGAFKLDRVEGLLDDLGNPHFKLKSIHVAGTKGKGSTCAFLQSILKHARLKIGLYTSPHLISMRERIRINDELISEEDICELLEHAKPFIEKRRKDTSGEISFFEVYTVLAFLYFARKGVDFAVLETGLGGRLDATNIVNAQCCVITPISFDHTNILGRSIAEIAAEKSGIIKKGYSVICAPQDNEALDVIKSMCKEKNSSLYLVGKDIVCGNFRGYADSQRFSLRTLHQEYKDICISLLGVHQIINASCAIGAVEILKKKGAAIPNAAISQGLKAAAWPGRLQVISRRPYIVLDGAQNGGSAKVLKEAISSIFRYNKLLLVLGVSKDKDIEAIADQLCPGSDTVILTQARNPRAIGPQELLSRLQKYSDKIIIEEDPKQALEKANALAGEGDLILVAGSLYLIGQILKDFKNEVELIR